MSPKDWELERNDAVALLKHYHVKKFILCPTYWTDLPTATLNWKRVRFNAKGLKKLPDDKTGLYSFFAEPDVGGHKAIRYLLYLGQTTKQTLRKRCSQYLPESKREHGRVPIHSMIRKWPNHLWLHYAVVNDATTIKAIEESLLRSLIPPFNQEFTASIGKAGSLKEILKAVFE